MEQKFIIGLIVTNHFGVLNRVAALFSKRCYNIDSLAVGVTEDPKYSRMTIVSKGDEYMKQQVIRQLQKLHDVIKVEVLDYDNSVTVEHMLIKFTAQSDSNAKISELINSYGGKTMDFGLDFITAEITGSEEKIDAFIAETSAFGILEVCRSGLIGVTHGTQSILSTQTL